jgi:hypothetical protein
MIRDRRWQEEDGMFEWHTIRRRYSFNVGTINLETLVIDAVRFNPSQGLVWSKRGHLGEGSNPSSPRP